MVLLNSDYERMMSGGYLLFTCQSFALLCRTLNTCAWCLACCLIEVVWLRVGARNVSGLSLNSWVNIVVIQDCKPGVGGGSYWNYEWTSKHGRGGSYLLVLRYFYLPILYFFVLCPSCFSFVVITVLQSRSWKTTKYSRCSSEATGGDIQGDDSFYKLYKV